MSVRRSKNFTDFFCFLARDLSFFMKTATFGEKSERNKDILVDAVCIFYYNYDVRGCLPCIVRTGSKKMSTFRQCFNGGVRLPTSSLFCILPSRKDKQLFAPEFPSAKKSATPLYAIGSSGSYARRWLDWKPPFRQVWTWSSSLVQEWSQCRLKLSSSRFCTS